MRTWITAENWVHNLKSHNLKSCLESLVSHNGSTVTKKSAEKFALAYILHCVRWHACIKSVGCMYCWSFAQKHTLAIHLVELTRGSISPVSFGRAFRNWTGLSWEASLCSNHCISVITFKSYSTKNSADGKCSQIWKMPRSRTCEKLAA